MSRTLRPLAAFAMLAVIVAGCSNTPAKSGTGSSGGSSGGTTTAAETGTRSSSGGNTTTTAATAPAGGSGSAGQTPLAPQQSTGQQLSPAQQQAWLSWAKCIRAHGVPNFSDPTFPADVPGAVQIYGAFSRASGPRGRAPVANSPPLRSAMDACKSQMPSTRGLGG